MKKNILLIALLTSACAKTLDNHVETSSSDVQNISFNINFFKYKTIGQCSDGTLRFKYLSGSGVIFDFDPALTQDIRTAQIEIYLKDNNTYDAHYREFVNGTLTADQIITEKYSNTNDTIRMENLGRATFSFVNNKFSLNLIFEKDIITTGLANKEITLHSVLASNGLITNEEYCNN
jgi:hypothetical protein